MSTALVTGGTGFVGSHIARMLIEAGHTARVLHRPTSKLDLLQDLPVEHALGDVMDRDSLNRAMQGCEWVFHAAAVADYWRAERVKMYMVNVHGTRYVLEAARRQNVHRVIITSSAAALGVRPDGKPADESLPFNLPPDRFAYGHSKYLAELEALKAVEDGQDIVLLNPGAILGPGDLNQISGSNIVEFARGLVAPLYPTGGTTFIDVRDVARAHLVAAERGRIGERYNLGTTDMAWRALWEIMCRTVGVRPPALPMPTWLAPVVALGIGSARRVGMKLPIDANQVLLAARDLYFDCNKAWRELGKPEISIEQSVQDTYDWYVAKGIITRRAS